MKKIVVFFALLLTLTMVPCFSQEKKDTTTTKAATTISVTPGYRLVKRVTIMPEDNLGGPYVVLLLDHGQMVEIRHQIGETYYHRPIYGTEKKAFTLHPGDEVMIRPDRRGNYILVNVKYYMHTL